MAGSPGAPRRGQTAHCSGGSLHPRRGDGCHQGPLWRGLSTVLIFCYPGNFLVIGGVCGRQEAADCSEFAEFLSAVFHFALLPVAVEPSHESSRTLFVQVGCFFVYCKVVCQVPLGFLPVYVGSPLRATPLLLSGPTKDCSFQTPPLFTVDRLVEIGDIKDALLRCRSASFLAQSPQAEEGRRFAGARRSAWGRSVLPFCAAVRLQ